MNASTPSEKSQSPHVFTNHSLACFCTGQRAGQAVTDEELIFQSLSLHTAIAILASTLQTFFTCQVHPTPNSLFSATNHFFLLLLSIFHFLGAKLENRD
jgi:hypothetical protein